jgi:transcriptional regulator with XRE-family HTH domain
MNADPLWRLLAAFGAVIFKQKMARKLSADGLATATELSVDDLTLIERGHLSPTLPEFFRLARAFGKEPPILLIDLISEWRTEQAVTLNRSRASDFGRLFRLGYHHKTGDFRELALPYHSLPQAIHAAEKLNAQRHSRGVAPIDTVCTYVRLEYAGLPTDRPPVTTEGG